MTRVLYVDLVKDISHLVFNGPAVLDQLDFRLHPGLSESIRFQGERIVQHVPNPSFVLGLSDNGYPIGSIGADSPVVIFVMVGGHQISDGLLSDGFSDLAHGFQRLYLVVGSLHYQNKLLKIHPHGVHPLAFSEVHSLGEFGWFHRHRVQLS